MIHLRCVLRRPPLRASRRVQADVSSVEKNSDGLLRCSKKDGSLNSLRTVSDDRDRLGAECGTFWSCWYLLRLQHPLVLKLSDVSTCISVV